MFQNNLRKYDEHYKIRDHVGKILYFSYMEYVTRKKTNSGKMVKECLSQL